MYNLSNWAHFLYATNSRIIPIVAVKRRLNGDWNYNLTVVIYPIEILKCRTFPKMCPIQKCDTSAKMYGIENKEKTRFIVFD